MGHFLFLRSFLLHELAQGDAVEEFVDELAQLGPHGAAGAAALALGVAADGQVVNDKGKKKKSQCWTSLVVQWLRL